MRLKMISAMAAALLLAACASDEAATTGDANASGGSGTTNGITQTVTPGSPQDFQAECRRPRVLRHRSL